MGSMKDLITKMEDAGYSHSEIWKRMGSTDKQWKDYLEERDREDEEMTTIVPAKSRVTKTKNASTSKTVEPYEPFEGDDGRMAYRDDNGRIHKEYIDEDDRDNDPDYWQ